MKNVSTYVVIVVAIGLFIFLAIRRREEVFEGEVIDKNIVESQVMNNAYGNPAMREPGIMIGNTGGLRHTYTIKVKTDQGKVINYTISEGKYEIIKIGDRVSKPKGTAEITIVSSNTSASSAPPSDASSVGPMPTNLNPPQAIS